MALYSVNFNSRTGLYHYFYVLIVERFENTSHFEHHQRRFVGSFKQLCLLFKVNKQSSLCKFELIWSDLMSNFESRKLRNDYQITIYIRVEEKDDMNTIFDH
ncbi:hypothetical protein T02_11892 [Trichinella nativa]|uniref:Uncharacterized protein n=1 Tax=Trichinella nativa TaxID=6335 RepID=A0A0V1KYI3_9BILA|nr:hypothetical protein T02_11892 [Trichinella nativa]